MESESSSEDEAEIESHLYSLLHYCEDDVDMGDCEKMQIAESTTCKTSTIPMYPINSTGLTRKNSPIIRTENENEGFDSNGVKLKNSVPSYKRKRNTLPRYYLFNQLINNRDSDVGWKRVNSVTSASQNCIAINLNDVNENSKVFEQINGEKRKRRKPNKNKHNLPVNCKELLQLYEESQIEYLKSSAYICNNVETYEQKNSNLQKHVDMTNLQNISREMAVVSKNVVSPEPKNFSLKDGSLNITRTIWNKQTDSKCDKDDSALSKYGVCKKKNNNDNEIVIITDSDSDNGSIFEFLPPIKTPPPVLEVSSDEELVIKTESSDNDIMIVFDSDKPFTSTSNDSIQQIPLKEINSSEKVKIKRKREKRKNTQPEPDSYVSKKSWYDEIGGRKRKKRKKSKSKPAPYVSKMSWYDEIGGPPGWAGDMTRFYEESWGGENFDMVKLQNRMSDDPTKWKVSYDDFVSPISHKHQRNKKCKNCYRWGHVTNLCPWPCKPILCYFCGKKGHFKERCPSAICLGCGIASKSFKFIARCAYCNTSSRSCKNCGGTTHYLNVCPEVWRKYFAVTSHEDIVNMSHPRYKPQSEQYCCNCSKRGHQFLQCKQYQQVRWKT